MGEESSSGLPALLCSWKKSGMITSRASARELSADMRRDDSKGVTKSAGRQNLRLKHRTRRTERAAACGDNDGAWVKQHELQRNQSSPGYS